MLGFPDAASYFEAKERVEFVGSVLASGIPSAMAYTGEG
jgi:hypothetical protein